MKIERKVEERRDFAEKSLKNADKFQKDHHRNEMWKTLNKVYTPEDKRGC